MADKKFTQLTAAGVLTVNDLLAIAQSPFGAGSSKSITGADLATFINATVAGAGTYLPLAGGTMVGNLLFTDNSFDIGATGATRLRSLFAATNLNVQRTALGAATVDATILANTTAAALGAQQWSPAVRLQGFGWGTTLGSSQACDWRIYANTVQSTVPTSSLKFEFSVAGGGFTTPASLSSAGVLSAISLEATGSSIIVSAAGVFSFLSRARIKSSADGILELFNAGNSDFTRLNFGGTTSSFPAIARTLTALDFVLADASGPCQISCGKNAIGGTPDDALIVKNTTAATVGMDQFSPALRLQGFGWGTTAGTSQACDWRIYHITSQGLVPTSLLRMDVSIAGGAFTTPFSLANSGALSIGSLSVSAGAWISWSGRSNLASSANGLFELLNGAGTDFTRLNFGGTTSAFPAIARSTTFLDLVLADASGPCQVSCGKNAIGATPTDALIIKNTTAAALGAQQWSPAIRLQASGWGTTLGSSQGCEWRVYVAPVQGLVPTNPLVFASSVAGAAFAAVASISTAGSIAGTSLSASGNLFVTSKIFITSRTVLSSPADGILSLADSTELLWNRLNLGLNTNAFPALTRSGTNILLTLGDGTGNAGLTTGNLTTVASQTHKYLGINAVTVLDATHYCVNATANTFDVTLPTAVAVAGRTYVIKNSGTGVVTLKANGAETIDGVASWIINQYTSLTAMSDGAGWILN
jgi:hypothetical protein